MSVLLETSLGDVVIDLYTKARPRCSLNFLKLCKLKMYNFCLVHNVQRNFMIQTGDIDEKGGSSVFKIVYGEQAKLFEREALPKLKHTDKLTVSMVNDGNGYHGSQFLITTRDEADVLDGVHTVFGTIVEGEDVITQMNEAYVDEDGRPYQDIRIHHTIVLHDPFPDPGELPVPPRSPSPPLHVVESDRLAVGEVINKLAGHTTEEVVEFIEEKELKANTQMLEIIGDIPDADVKPPEDVLFVCKLNPVTTSDDLEIIFSRFGPIESCEVIRDWKSQDSLCYAFIEFQEVADCEAAYFKMDNVLIDERRIHVDFSQSVSKLYWNRNTKNRGKYTGEGGPQQGNKEHNRERGGNNRRGNHNRRDNHDRMDNRYGARDNQIASDSDKHKNSRDHQQERDRSDPRHAPQNTDRTRDRGEPRVPHERSYHERSRDRGGDNHERSRGRDTDNHERDSRGNGRLASNDKRRDTDRRHEREREEGEREMEKRKRDHNSDRQADHRRKLDTQQPEALADKKERVKHQHDKKQEKDRENENEKEKHRRKKAKHLQNEIDNLQSKIKDRKLESSSSSDTSSEDSGSPEPVKVHKKSTKKSKKHKHSADAVHKKLNKGKKKKRVQ